MGERSTSVASIGVGQTDRRDSPQYTELHGEEKKRGKKLLLLGHFQFDVVGPRGAGVDPSPDRGDLFRGQLGLALGWHSLLFVVRADELVEVTFGTLARHDGGSPQSPGVRAKARVFMLYSPRGLRLVLPPWQR